MTRKKICLLSAVAILCSCAGKILPSVEKNFNALVCYAGDKEDDYFGKSIDSIIRKVDSNQNNNVKLTPFELGTNGSNYTDLLDFKINNDNYDYVMVIGEKANLYLATYMKNMQGVPFICIDSKTETNYVNVASYEFAPEEVGFLNGYNIKVNENVGYMSSYDTTFDKKILYGFMQGQKALGNKANIVLRYLEEEFNYEKTCDYTKDLFSTYNCSTIFENAKDNLSVIIDQASLYSKKIVSSNVDYLLNIEQSNNDAVQNILVQNYEKVLLDICDSIKNNTIEFNTTTELKYADNYLYFKNKVEIDDKINEIKKFSDVDEYDALYDEMIKNTEVDYSPKYSVDIPYHEAIPNCGEQNNWKHAPRFGADNGMKPASWTAVGAWATIYAQEGFPRAKNTGIEFKNMRIWGYSEKLGWKLIEWANPVGSFYDEDFVDDYHQDFPSNCFNDEKTKTTKIKLDNTNIGFNYHPFSSQNDLASIGLSDLKYIVSTMDIRLVVWDSNRPNDIQKAKYVANIGGDWWAYKGATWKPDWSANRDICVAQFRTITPNWKTLYMTNVPVDQYDQIIGEGQFLKEFE